MQRGAVESRQQEEQYIFSVESLEMQHYIQNELRRAKQKVNTHKHLL